MKLTNAILVAQIHLSKGEFLLQGEWFSRCIQFEGNGGHRGFLFSESSNPQDVLLTPVKLLWIDGRCTMHGQSTDWAGAVGKKRHSLKRPADSVAGPAPSRHGDFTPLGVFAAASAPLIPSRVDQYTPGVGAIFGTAAAASAPLRACGGVKSASGADAGYGATAAGSVSVSPWGGLFSVPPVPYLPPLPPPPLPPWAVGGWYAAGAAVAAGAVAGSGASAVQDDVWSGGRHAFGFGTAAAGLGVAPPRARAVVPVAGRTRAEWTPVAPVAN